MPVTDSIQALNDSSVVIDSQSFEVGSSTVGADSLSVSVALDDSLSICEPIPSTIVETTKPAWTDGLLPVRRPTDIGAAPEFVTTVVLIILGLSLSFRIIKRIWGTLIRRLWTTRSREVFDSFTITENRTIGLMLVAAVFFLAVIASTGLSLVFPARFPFDFASTLTLASVIAGYFVFQYAVYALIGYTFLTTDGTRRWLEGFTATMSLLGIILLIPTLVVLFYPEFIVPAIYVAAVFYALARIMFICKGFRIFYTNLASLVYFILYLCSLEIVPLTIFYFFASQY